jgi:arsenate reductase
MYSEIIKITERFGDDLISDDRKKLLQPLTTYIRSKVLAGEPARLNFICTHNSRRSHLSQIWAQTMAFRFGIKNISCYSGGTEATAMFPKVAETLISQGFQIEKLSETENPVYAVKFDQNEAPVICFSKKYAHAFNPKNSFGAVMTCSQADEGCPVVFGAEARFPIPYDDPKAFDGTDQQTEKYLERSLDIACEMWWVFSQV